MASGAPPAQLNFPSGVDVFSTKTDRNVIISGESHVIPLTPSYELFLDYVPLEASPSTITIPGYTEVSGVPATFEFNTVYSGTQAGLLTFNALQSGLSISATYTAFGDVIEAENINSLQTSIVNVEDYVLANVASGDFVATSGGTMTGDLTMNADVVLSAGNVTASTSGTNSIATATVPLANVYSDIVTTDFVIANSPLTLSGDSIYLNTTGGTGDAQVDGALSPAVDSTHDFGTSALAWNVAYFNSLGKNVILASGVNLTVLVSGTNDIGSLSSPLNALYADNITSENITSPSIATGLSGTFVHVVGDTMTGTLSIASGSSVDSFLVENSAGDLTLSSFSDIRFSNHVIPTSSGIYNVGSSDNPVDTIYVKTIDGGSLTGNFVSKAGDTMTGELNVSGANIVISSGNEINVDAITEAGSAGYILVDSHAPYGGSGTNQIGTPSIPYGTGRIKALETNAITNYDGIVPLTITSTLQGVLYQIGDSDTGHEINAGASYAKFASSGTSTPGITLRSEVDGVTAIIMSGSAVNVSGNVIPMTSGTYNLGSAELPWQRVYADELVDTSGASIYVEKAGDTMTGDLTMSSAGIKDSTSFLDSSENSIAFGAGNVASGTNSQAFGSATKAIGNYSHAEGLNSLADGWYSHAEGVSTALGFYAHSEGNGSTASGATSHAEGLNTQALESQSHAEGNTTIALGVNSHAEGNTTTALGTNSHAEGAGTIASGNNSHAEGASTTAIGVQSHAEGASNTASGNNSHVEGASNWSIGLQSHAEGTNNTAFGDQSHVEGSNNTAVGVQSHAEGNSTIASGSLSHAAGDFTVSDGSASYAGGSLSVARGDYSFAHGRQVETEFSGSFFLGDSQDLGGAGVSVNDVVDSMRLRFQNGVTLHSGTDFLTVESGVTNIGSASLPFNNVYTKNLNATNILGLSPINISADQINLSGTINTSGSSIILPSVPPASGTAQGTIGEMIVGTDGYIYGCSGTNLWGRVALSTF